MADILCLCILQSNYCHWRALTGTGRLADDEGLPSLCHRIGTKKILCKKRPVVAWDYYPEELLIGEVTIASLRWLDRLLKWELIRRATRMLWLLYYCRFKRFCCCTSFLDRNF